MKTRPHSAMQRVENMMMNKSGTRKDVDAWKAVKEYIWFLEEELEKENKTSYK